MDCKLLRAEQLAGDTLAKDVASLPGRLGGLSLRSAVRSAPGAHVAAWLDALPALRQRAPDLAAKVQQGLAEDGRPTAARIPELRQMAAQVT